MRSTAVSVRATTSMKNEFNPVNTWIRHGTSDLYFGHANQDNDVYRYGTFFFIMAAEKHLKAMLIEDNKEQYESALTLHDKRKKVDKIARKYSHNFEKMIKDVSTIYLRDTGRTFLDSEIYGYELKAVATSMYEGYMETRYPSVLQTARHYPFPNAEGSFHDPLGSSFFTDFAKEICQKAWCYLVDRGADFTGIVESIDEQYRESKDYGYFQSTYISKLPVKREQVKEIEA